MAESITLSDEAAAFLRQLKRQQKLSFSEVVLSLRDKTRGSPEAILKIQAHGENDPNKRGREQARARLHRDFTKRLRRGAT